MQSRDELAKDYQIVFGTEEGKRVLADLREKSGFDMVSMLYTDDRKQVYVAGSASIFKYILENVEPNNERNRNGRPNTTNDPDDFGY